MPMWLSHRFEPNCYVRVTGLCGPFRATQGGMKTASARGNRGEEGSSECGTLPVPTARSRSPSRSFQRRQQRAPPSARSKRGHTFKRAAGSLDLWLSALAVAPVPRSPFSGGPASIPRREKGSRPEQSCRGTLKR